MEETLQNILINTYNPNNALRTQAEQALGLFVRERGALPAALRFIGNVNNHKELRQATGIFIKNNLRAVWTEEGRMDADDKEAVKVGLIQVLLAETENSIRGLLAESIRIVSEFEFPANWPALIPSLLVNVQNLNGDVLRMFNSLVALRKIIKRYEYKQKEARVVLNELIAAIFPYLQPLMKMVIEHRSIEAAMVLRMGLKIFYSSTMYALPVGVAGIDVALWFQLIGTMLEMDMPEGQPVDVDERKTWPWWKLKKWAGRIVTLFIQRYGNPRYAGEEYKQFAEYFKSTVSVQLLAPVLKNLSVKVNGGYLTDDVHRMCLSYLSSCVEMSPTYKILKSQLDFIIKAVVFPALCLTPEEITLFSEDPVEFVRKVHSPMEDWLSPSVAASTLLQMLARYRQKDVMPTLLVHISSILGAYEAALPEHRDYRLKDGVLVTMANLTKILGESKQYAHQVAPFLVKHVIPEFKCPVAFIRARACWAIEYFHDMNWADDDGKTLRDVLEGLFLGLTDPAVPVQTAAACSLRLLIEAKGATDLLRPHLGEIIRQYFRIMDEVENESVLSALQAIVMQYGEEIAVYAPAMVERLITCFKGYADQGADDDEAAFNASQCLDTMCAILDAVQEKADSLMQLEPLIVPLLVSLLVGNDDCFEYIDGAVQMMSYLTYYSDTVTPLMWTLCGPLLSALHEWAIDYIAEIMVPVLNYISKDANTFLEGQFQGKYLTMILLQIIEKVFSNDESDGGRDSKAAATLLTALITCSRASQKLHSIMPQILHMTLTKLQTAKGQGLRVLLLETVLGSLYYDVNLTMQVFHSMSEQSGTDVSKAVFTILFDNLAIMERDFTQRLIVLAFSSILTIPAANLPEILRNNVQAMFMQTIRELTMIAEEERTGAKRAAEEGDDYEDMDDFGEGYNEDEDIEVDSDEDGEFDGDDEDEDTERITEHAKMLHVPEGGYGEDEDCLNAEDETYRAALESMDKEERVKRELYLAGEPVDDEDDGEFVFTSPIEVMDMTKYFMEVVHTISLRDSTLIPSLQAKLDGEDAARLQELIAAAQAKAAAGAVSA